MTVRRSHRATVWQVGETSLSDGEHTLIMGVLNVTPDSFSDGGQFADAESAVAHGLEMYGDGADLIDVGGESTRPGADPVPAATEIDRVVPVVAALAAAGVVVCVDTSKADVAAAAIESGASAVNDVTAMGDPSMASVVAGSGAGLVLMHMQGEPRTMQENPRYDDVVEDVAAELEQAAARAVAAGVAEESICLDPGIGFGKTVPHNVDLLALGVSRLTDTGFPVLIGVSRKSFLTKILGSLDIDARDAVSATAQVLAIASGASIIRSHNVVMSLRTARVADAIVRGL